MASVTDRAAPAAATDLAGDMPAIGGIIRRALLTGLVALGLLGPFVGLLTTQNIRNQLIIESRPLLLAVLIGIIMGIRVMIDLPLRQRGYALIAGALVLFAVGAIYLFGSADAAAGRELGFLYAVFGVVVLVIGLSVSVYRPQARALAGQFATLAGTRGFAFFLLGLALAYPPAVLGYFGPGGALKYIDNFGIQVLIYVMLGWGLNIVVGLAGLLDLGYVAFYAVGAYTYALLAKEFGLSFWLLLPVAGTLAALWGVMLGFPVLRLRGDYLAIVTLAFGEIIRLVLVNWIAFSNGYEGIQSIPKPSFFGIPFNATDQGFAAVFDLPQSSVWYKAYLYYIILGLCLLTAFVTLRLRRLPIGRAWEALREDEIACRSLGINTTTTKLTAFALGAMFGGFAGAFFAARQGFVSPESFIFLESAQILAIVVLGGMGSLAGVAIAAFAMVGGFELLRELTFLKILFGQDFDPNIYRGLIFGAAMVLIMLWKPRGLISTREPTAFLKERKSVSGSHVKEGHG
jgi:branched-chain amino acid transport system permease protein